MPCRPEYLALMNTRARTSHEGGEILSARRWVGPGMARSAGVSGLFLSFGVLDELWDSSRRSCPGQTIREQMDQDALRIRRCSRRSEYMRSNVAGTIEARSSKTMLITGDTGLLGVGMVLRLLKSGASEVRFLSRDEQKQDDTCMTGGAAIRIATGWASGARLLACSVYTPRWFLGRIEGERDTCR